MSQWIFKMSSCGSNVGWSRLHQWSMPSLITLCSTSKNRTLLTYFQALCGSPKLRVWICIHMYISIQFELKFSTGQVASKPYRPVQNLATLLTQSDTASNHSHPALLSGRLVAPDSVINCVEVRTVQWPEIRKFIWVSYIIALSDLRQRVMHRMLW